MAEREPAPEKIRIPDVRIEIQAAFPGVTVKIQHGIKSGLAEVKFDEYELRVMLSGPVAEKRKANIRFVQRIERGRMRVFLDRKTDDWYEIVDAIREARAIVRGIIHSLNKALSPPVVRGIEDISDLFRDDV